MQQFSQTTCHVFWCNKEKYGDTNAFAMHIFYLFIYYPILFLVADKKFKRKPTKQIFSSKDTTNKCESGSGPFNVICVSPISLYIQTNQNNMVQHCRFPTDSLDRFWFTSTIGPTNVTSNTIDMSNIPDVVPMVVMQSNVMATTTDGLMYNFSIPGTHHYYINLFFVELDPQVTTGRVFDVSLNGVPNVKNVDVFDLSFGRYNWHSFFTSSAFGPYVDYVLITLTPSPSATYLPFLAALEVMQVFDNPMVVSTSSDDGMCFLI